MDVTRTRSHSFRRSLAAAAGLVVAALSLSSCGTPVVGAAAVVNGKRISVGELQQATLDLRAYAPPQAAASLTQSSVLLLLIIREPLHAALSSPALRAGQSLDAARQALLPKVPHPSTAAVEALQAELEVEAIQQLGQQAQQTGQAATLTALQQAIDSVRKQVAAQKVQVNPRYGKFDASQLRFTPETPNWLVTATPIPTPTLG